MMDRSWGKGSIVLCSDSYLVSNEAMQEQRHPELLAWLIGPSSRVIFDETHLGVAERPGVMTLIRRYRLAGVLGALAIVAGLFIWKNGASLVPKRDVREIVDLASPEGHDVTAGLSNLLRRSIAPGQVTAVCVAEWTRSSGQEPGISAEKRKRIKEVVQGEQSRPAGRRDPAGAYRMICAILAERDQNRGP